MSTSNTLYFISNTFIIDARLRLAKNQQNKEHPEAELLLFENYLLSLSKLLSKDNRRYSKKYTKNKCVFLMSLLMTTKIRLKMKNRSHIYSISRPRTRHGHKYTKYKI